MGRPFSAPKPLPTQDQLRALLSYDPEDGVLVWANRQASSFEGDETTKTLSAARWNSIYAGREAGGVRDGDYRRLMIDGVSHMSHRVIWKIVTGEDPIEIDHIDGDRNNNRFSNLRSVERAVNMKNKSLYANNKSGFPGVEFHQRDKVWVAKIGTGQKQVHLGSFPTKEEAIACKIGAQVILDFHANHGRPLNL